MGAIGFGLALALRRSGAGTAAFDFTGGTLPVGASLARASAGTRFNGAGALVSEAADVARFDYDPATLALRGLLVEAAATNRQSDYNASPAALSGIAKGGDAAATLAVTGDGAALAAAGLTIGNGSVFRLDNSGGTANAVASLSGMSGAAGGFVFSVFVRGGTGRLEQSNPGTAFAASSGYVRRQLAFTAAGSSAVCYVTAFAGQTLYFVLNQYEAGSAASSPIVVAGAAATRAADLLTLNWASRGVADGAATLRYTFDDLSTQDMAATISGGTTTVPAGLNRAWLRRIEKL